MQGLQQILSCIGLAVINSLWQMALLYGLYRLINSAIVCSASCRYRLSLLMSFGGTIWFIATLWASKPDSTPLPLQITGLNSFNASPIILNISMILGLSYAVMLPYFAIKSRKQQLGLRSLRMGNKVSARWRMFVQNHAQWIGIKRKIGILESTATSPATFGWMKPVILIPASCFTQLTPTQLEAVLLHELAHIRRNDYLWGLVLYTMEQILWFNPFIKALAAEARFECENACDDLVLQLNKNPTEYAKALLSLAKSSVSMPLAMQAKGSQNGLLLMRIGRITGAFTKNKVKVSEFRPYHALILAFSLTMALLANYPYSLQVASSKYPDALFVNNKAVAALPKKAAPLQETFRYERHIFIRNVIAQEKPFLAESKKNIHKKEVRQKEGANQKEMNERDIPVAAEMAGVQNEAVQPVILSASWAAGQQVPNASGEEETNTGWQQLGKLLEKLEQEGKLLNTEWEELTLAIAKYSAIKEAIYRETIRKSEPAQLSSAIVTNTEEQSKVLLIVFDEATGTLASSLVATEQLNPVLLSYQLNHNEQQVIFLRKKADGKSKTIRL